MLIHRNVIKSLVVATTPDDSRYIAMNAIQVDPDTQQCIATDGSILIRAASPSVDDAGEFPDPNAGVAVNGLLDAAVLLRAAKATPKRSVIPILANVAVTSTTTFVAGIGSDRSELTGEDKHDQTFPAWDHVISGPPAGANAFTLRADLLDKLVKVARAQGRGKFDAHVTFHVVEDQVSKSVYVDFGPAGDSPKVDGVVMPFRVDK